MQVNLRAGAWIQIDCKDKKILIARTAEVIRSCGAECPINKTGRGSWNFVFMTQGDTSNNANHNFWVKVCQSILKQD